MSIELLDGLHDADRRSVLERTQIDSSTGWKALNSCIILSSQEIQAQGSCLPLFMLSLILAHLSLNIPSPKDQYRPQSLAHTCEIPSLLFLQLSVQKMLCSNHPIGFTNAVWKSKQSHCFLKWLGTWYSKWFFFFLNPHFRITLHGSTEWGEKDE